MQNKISKFIFFLKPYTLMHGVYYDNFQQLCLQTPLPKCRWRILKLQGLSWGNYPVDVDCGYILLSIDKGHHGGSVKLICIREEPLMIWGGPGQKRGKKFQQLLAREKKFISAQVGQEKKKLLSRLARKKISSVDWPEKKIQHEFSAWAPHQIING